MDVQPRSVLGLLLLLTNYLVSSEGSWQWWCLWRWWWSCWGMVGHCSGREWRRENARSHSTLADSSNSSSRGCEASVGDHGECDLSSCRGALDYGSCPWAAWGNELAWQELDCLEGWSSCSRKLTRNQLDIELLRLRGGILGAVACLVEDLWTRGYCAVGRGDLWSR